LLEEMGAAVRKGLAYPDALRALLLAAVRGVEPRPVGFKFHAVLAIHAAHQASMAAQGSDRWLPLLWSLDLFKSAQAQQRAGNGWTLPAANESALPGAAQAPQAFLSAMERWDGEAAAAAASSLARHHGEGEVFELF
jgi:hypothetical protein